MDAPVAALSGLSLTADPGLGALLGTTRAFDLAELARRYPAGQAGYVAAFRAATERAVQAGFLLGEDLAEMVAVADAAYPPPPAR